MKIIDLPLKKEWYDMIESGIKTEEYREIKPYWEKRLLDYKAIKANAKGIAFMKIVLGLGFDACAEFPRGYTHVRFRYGYTKRTMTFKINEITMGYGKPEWGAPKDRKVFIIKFENIKEKIEL